VTDAEAPVLPSGAGQRAVVKQGFAATLVAGALLLAGLASAQVLGVALLVLQVLLLLGFLALVEAPALTGVSIIAGVAAFVADIAVVHERGRLGALAGVVALSLVAALLHQLGRRGRTRVTESLADTLVAVVLVCSCACLLAVRQLAGGRLAAIALAALGVSLLAGRLGDAVRSRPSLAVGATRGWLGFGLALALGPVAAAVVAALIGDDRISVGSAALLGLSVAAVAAAGDLAVDLAAIELAGPEDARRLAARRPVGLLLPFAAAGPVAYLAVQLVLAST
jgi:hypothetical protein